MLICSRRPSRHFKPSPADSAASAKLLGQQIELARLLNGSSIEELAPLVALTAPEWEALEAGQLPDSMVYIYLIGAVLQISCKGRDWLARLYDNAMRNAPER